MSSSPILRFVRLTEKAIHPTRGSARAAGLDLYSACDTIVPARGKVLIPTDLQIHVPDGCYGRIAPRSGLALHQNIDVGGGVINGDYRGNVGVILFNAIQCLSAIRRVHTCLGLAPEKGRHGLLPGRLPGESRYLGWEAIVAWCV